LWRRSTRMAVMSGCVVFPLSIWSCFLMRWQYGNGAAFVCCGNIHLLSCACIISSNMVRRKCDADVPVSRCRVLRIGPP
jgi:hypothetical protein